MIATLIDFSEDKNVEWPLLNSESPVGNIQDGNLRVCYIGPELATSTVAHSKWSESYASPHGKEQRVNQNRNIHKEAAVSDVVEVILNVFVDQEGSVGAQLP